jgi:transcriptional regulator with XRE-family HTH domain
MPRRTRYVDNAYYVDLGARLRLTRKKAKITQEAMSKLIDDQGGVTFQQIQKYELGTNRIPVDRLVKWSIVCSVPLIELLPHDERIMA